MGVGHAAWAGSAKEHRSPHSLLKHNFWGGINNLVVGLRGPERGRNQGVVGITDRGGEGGLVSLEEAGAE